MSEEAKYYESKSYYFTIGSAIYYHSVDECGESEMLMGEWDMFTKQELIGMKLMST